MSALVSCSSGIYNHTENYWLGICISFVWISPQFELISCLIYFLALQQIKCNVIGCNLQFLTQLTNAVKKNTQKSYLSKIYLSKILLC